MMTDPFIVHTPEQLTPESIAQNFVEMYTDFPKLKEPVNMFIHGARGAGKSIMLRSLELPVQRLLQSHSELTFFAIHVPIKRSFFSNPEYLRLKDWKGTAIGEHLLCVYALQYIFSAVQELPQSPSSQFFQEFSEIWEDCGGKPQVEEILSAKSFDNLARFCSRENSRVRQYYVRLPATGENPIYSGALASFADCLLPTIQLLQKDIFKHDHRPLCLMIDDADNLTEVMQRILNSWISTRAAQHVCFKVTTQLGYKTYKTIDNRIIESPHDFSEVNIGSVYTSSKASFARRIRAIVDKRLRNAGISAAPEDFFPSDATQESRKQEIWNDLTENRTKGYLSLRGSGPSRHRDQAQRYAIPALMRELASGKSAHTYSYSGLQSLTDLSSGVVRWFLEPAGQMYNEVASTRSDGKPEFIPVGIQDAEILKWSRAFREKLAVDPGGEDFDDADASLHTAGHSKEAYEQLGNLLDSIGHLCREKLLDPSASEQRVFSFALTDLPTTHLQGILQLGVRLGYLQKSDLASKSIAGGRRPRYILSRRLGPYYRLDVSGYAAHLSVKSADLHIALRDPRAFVRARLKTEGEATSQKSMDFGGEQ